MLRAVQESFDTDSVITFVGYVTCCAGELCCSVAKAEKWLDFVIMYVDYTLRAV